MQSLGSIHADLGQPLGESFAAASSSDDAVNNGGTKSVAVSGMEKNRLLQIANQREYTRFAIITSFGPLSAMVPTRFEFAAKAARVNMRLPTTLLEAVKAKAASQGMPYQRYIRQALEHAVGDEKGRRVSGYYRKSDLIGR